MRKFRTLPLLFVFAGLGISLQSYAGGGPAESGSDEESEVSEVGGKQGDGSGYVADLEDGWVQLKTVTLQPSVPSTLLPSAVSMTVPSFQTTEPGAVQNNGPHPSRDPQIGLLLPNQRNEEKEPKENDQALTLDTSLQEPNSLQLALIKNTILEELVPEERAPQKCYRISRKWAGPLLAAGIFLVKVLRNARDLSIPGDDFNSLDCNFCRYGSELGFSITDSEIGWRYRNSAHLASKALARTSKEVSLYNQDRSLVPLSGPGTEISNTASLGQWNIPKSKALILFPSKAMTLFSDGYDFQCDFETLVGRFQEFYEDRLKSSNGMDVLSTLKVLIALGGAYGCTKRISAVVDYIQLLMSTPPFVPHNY